MAVAEALLAQAGESDRMMLTGRIYKAKSALWVVEVDAIGAYTQGDTRKHADEMLVDLIHTMLQAKDLQVTITDDGPDGAILIEADRPAVLAAMVLRYQRERNGLSLADVAKKLGASSRNAYATYEKGRTEPSLSKLGELLAVVAPDIVLKLAPRSSSKRKATKAVR